VAAAVREGGGGSSGEEGKVPKREASRDLAAAKQPWRQRRWVAAVLDEMLMANRGAQDRQQQNLFMKSSTFAKVE
jgi:hypothetical protein